ncbi:hypothetical protein [Arthrobacter sp. 08Y14]|uniref:hypothetical protein n=1 Tax=Arthrobacter sp. 08Y14 TaxID=2058885 RepID=UPI0011B08DA1|nr:hypothetical protein [Arthrobacter sp. 08Y14]
MRSVEEIFGADRSDAYINLNWAGRRETPSVLAGRLASTLSMLSDRTGMSWYRDTADRNSHDVNFELVPTGAEALAEFLNPRTDEGWMDLPPWMGFHILLRASSDRNAKTLATLSGSTASSMERRNEIHLELADDFPLGTPSEAARWFLELVRTWQPDHARLSNSAAQRVTGLTRAAYLSWTSAIAYTEPESAQEIGIAFGDGKLRAARVWTPEGIVALNRELAQAGAPRYSNRPTQQNPPTFPEDYPEELSTLDREIIVEYGVSATDE